MKKFIAFLGMLLLSPLHAQFLITVEAPASFTPKEVYVYTLNGSKDFLNTKALRSGNQWQIKVKEPYRGMIKLFFPENNLSLNLISENKDVRLRFDVVQGKITEVHYLDESNALMNSLQDIQQKKEMMLPVLFQMKEYYKSNSDFGRAIESEMNRLQAPAPDLKKNPFVAFYNANYAKYIEKSASKPAVTHADIISFLTGANEMLESSSLLRPVLMAYLNVGPNTNLATDIDKLLAAVNLETPRGQTVLSELIEILDAYDMKALKEKYLTQAKNLKCTINDRLAGTLATNLNTEIGAVFPDYTFIQAKNTKAKTLSAVPAAKKVILFWSSTCSHCEAELPTLIQNYAAFQKQNIELIAFSLDSNSEAYSSKIKDLPWINDSELRGWNSTYVDKYNIHATPTYFVLDAQNRIIAKPDHAADVISFLNLK